jgi:simple sugar transport system ATP-binding protein
MTGTLVMSNISKSFGGNPVLKQADFSVHPGEVHALVGVNGAGKSTLMKILSGDIRKDSGSIRIGDREIEISSPIDARREGIRIVVQEVDTALIPNLSVAENVTLEEILGGPAWISQKKQHETARKLLAEVGIGLDVKKTANECTLAEKQLILIARALAGQVKFLILDEPTAPLSLRETETLFRVIRQLAGRGVGIIYISHRLPEIKALADRVTVMRDGRVVTTRDTADFSEEEIVQEMLGKTFNPPAPSANKRTGKILAEIDRFFVPATGQTLSLTIHEGEIVGIAGLVGAGKTETARALFGADPGHGTWIIRGRACRIQSPEEAIRAGICLVPEERRKEGVLVDFPVVQNLSLPTLRTFSPRGWIRRREEDEFARRLMERLKIKAPSPFHPVSRLSGGNQQKVSIGKWLDARADLYLFDEPTKGIDIGAKQEVFRLIRDLTAQGKGILYFTSEFSELLSIADRILVMASGRITAEWQRSEASLEKIVHAATGGYHGTGTY